MNKICKVSMPQLSFSTCVFRLFLWVAFLVSFQCALSAKALPAGRTGKSAHGVRPGHVGIQLLWTGKALFTFFAGVGFPWGVLLLLVSTELNQAGECEVALGARVLTRWGRLCFRFLLLC